MLPSAISTPSASGAAPITSILVPRSMIAPAALVRRARDRGWVGYFKRVRAYVHNALLGNSTVVRFR
jgi:hypothetical protein